MWLYLAHNWDTNTTMELTEEQLETYAPEIQAGIIVVYETTIIEEDYE